MEEIVIGIFCFILGWFVGGRMGWAAGFDFCKRENERLEEYRLAKIKSVK